MKKIGILLITLAGLLMIGVTANAGVIKSIQMSLGEVFADSIETQTLEKEDPVATDKDHTVTMNMIEYQRSTTTTLSQDTNAPALTDREIIDNILKNIMLEEEAKSRGIYVSEKDIEEFLDSTVYASYEIEEGKVFIDEYCEGAGLTFDEYVASVREAAPSIILKARLEREIAETYCEENSLVFDELNPSQEIRDTIKEEENSIFEAHKDEIQYYVK